MRDKPPETFGDRLGRVCLVAFCVAVVVFLILPMLVVVPLSFNAAPHFTFTEGMLRLDPDAYSLRWYRAVLEDDSWLQAVRNSLTIGLAATAIATVLGTLAALGLASPHMPGRGVVTSLLISPLITPIIISAVGMSFFFGDIGLAQTHAGLIFAHAALCTPFVIITVTATLSNYNHNLNRAAASLGAHPVTAFFHVQLPLIAPGVISGALFAFVISLDEVIVVTFLGGLDQRTIPRQMWSGVQEHLNPEILAVATLLALFAALVLTTVEWLRRRGTD